MSEVNAKTKSQRQLQKDQTRKLILATAFQLYASQGILGTRTSDIAKAAKVSHGTIFVHFATQEELVSTVIEEFGSQVSLRLHELVEGNSSLREILAAHLKGLQEYEEFYIRLVMEGRVLPVRARNVLTMIQSTISFHIGQAAEREMKAGQIQSQPIHLLFNTWVGLIHYYLMNNDLFAPGESVLRRYGPELLEHYLKLIQ